MKVVSVVGARPQLVKLAPIAAAMATTSHEHRIIHTGQHYDADLSDVFFSGLNIPAPDVHLGVGSGSHGVQTAAMLAALDPIFAEDTPDWVLVYGDTNSTIAAALAAVKLHVPVAHLEAGLRSFNRRMPEEHNRVLTDHASDLLLAPTQTAMNHLAAENLAHRARLVGDVMADVCLQVRDSVLAEPPRPDGLPKALDRRAPYVVCTVHRPDNTDDPDRLRALVAALAGLPVQVALMAHPRLVDRAQAHGVVLEQGSIVVGRPLSYAAMISAILGAEGVLTDSGGLQKEAFLLGRATTTLRPETEWVETLANDWNTLLPDPHLLSSEELAAVVLRGAPSTPREAPYGAGDAARKVVLALEEPYV